MEWAHLCQAVMREAGAACGTAERTQAVPDYLRARDTLRSARQTITAVGAGVGQADPPYARVAAAMAAGMMLSLDLLERLLDSLDGAHDGPADQPSA